MVRSDAKHRVSNHEGKKLPDRLNYLAGPHEYRGGRASCRNWKLAAIAVHFARLTVAAPKGLATA